jgi:hypothetical protein
METSRIFYTDTYHEIESEIQNLLNSQDDFLSNRTVRSTRATGDAVEEILKDNFEDILGDWCQEYSADFARRAMADFAFRDFEDFYYVIDVKTHRTDTKFNMPNLTSVRRLARLYEDDKNYFALILASYHTEKTKAVFTQVRFIPVEFLDWSSLTIGALGWGQIQIANSNNIIVNPKYSRRDWMIELCDAVLQFYPKELLKIDQRIQKFREIREYWLSRSDV